MKSIEEKYADFIQHCTTAYSYKQQSLRNEQQLIEIIAELVSLIRNVEQDKEDIIHKKMLSLGEMTTTLSSLADVVEKQSMQNTRAIAQEIRSIIHASLPKEGPYQYYLKFNNDGVVNEGDLECEDSAVHEVMPAPDVEGALSNTIALFPNKIHATSCSDTIIESITRVANQLRSQLQRDIRYTVLHSNDDECNPVQDIECVRDNDISQDDIYARDTQAAAQSVIWTLPLGEASDIAHLLPRRTVFDAIPLNKANVALLCTPLLASTQWEYVEYNAMEVLVRTTVKGILEHIHECKQSSSWIIE